MTKRELYKDIIYIDYLINNYLTIKNYGPSDDDNLNESIAERHFDPRKGLLLSIKLLVPAITTQLLGIKSEDFSSWI